LAGDATFEHFRNSEPLTDDSALEMTCTIARVRELQNQLQESDVLMRLLHLSKLNSFCSAPMRSHAAKRAASIVGSLATSLVLRGAAAGLGQTNAGFQPPGQGLAAGLFDLGEMDLHLHSGMERPVALAAWIDLAVADGRKVLLLLDHLELYRKTPEEYEAWRNKGKFQARYPVGVAGHRAFFADIDSAASLRNEVLVFKGWEVSEDELDEGLELAPMRMADVIGFHISPRNGKAPPNGQTLLKRVRQVKELQTQLPIPMILFHPFPMRIENLQKTARTKGRDPKTITEAEYRFFQPSEQDELIRLLRGTSIYIEMSRDTEQYFDDSTCRAALIADILPLAEAGVAFTVSTDNHHLAAARKHFEPDHYCGPTGVTAAHCNTIVRELLALRAKRAITEASPKPGSPRP
jgi:hypothetical protein